MSLRLGLKKKIDCKIVHELFVFGMHQYVPEMLYGPALLSFISIHAYLWKIDWHKLAVMIFTLDIIVWLKCGHLFYLSVCSPNCVHILLCLKFCVIMVLSPTILIFEWQIT